MDRQKKLLLFGAAWVSALLLTWFYYANAVAPKQEKTLRMVVATHDMPMGTLLKKSDLKVVNYPEKDVPKGSIFQLVAAENRVLMVPLNTNEPVLQGKLSDMTTVEGVSSTIDRGYRAVSVQVTDVSGVAGLIQPGSRVDVIFTRPGSMAEATTSTILQNVKVISTGRTVALVLLAPAFDLARRWQERMPPQDLARWRATGRFAFDHYAHGGKEDLAIGFLDDAQKHEPFPLPDAPALVIQGTRDEVVDPQLAREFVRRMDGRARLVELDQGHELTADLPGLWRLLEPFLQPWLPRPTP